MARNRALSNVAHNPSDNSQKETKGNQTQQTQQITSEQTVIENTNAEQDEAIQETANEIAREAGEEVQFDGRD